MISFEGNIISGAAEATKPFYIAACCGIPEAMFYFGRFSIMLDNRPEFVEEGLDWICKAAIKGNAGAYMYLIRYMTE